MTGLVFVGLCGRMKKVREPLGRLENDLKRLTAALTGGDTGITKPLFALCADGYLLCEQTN